MSIDLAALIEKFGTLAPDGICQMTRCADRVNPADFVIVFTAPELVEDYGTREYLICTECRDKGEAAWVSLNLLGWPWRVVREMPR